MSKKFLFCASLFNIVSLLKATLPSKKVYLLAVHATKARLCNKG